MDLVTLDSTTFKPKEDVVRSFDSFIWTERYFGSGEFELYTYDIAEASVKLRPGVLVSLLDSDVVMMVTTTLVEEDELGLRKFKATGKTLDFFLKFRAMHAIIYNEEWPTLKSYTGAQAASLLLWNNLVNNTLEDPSKPSGALYSNTSIPNVVVTDSTLMSMESRIWWFRQGNVLDMFKDVALADLIGIRTIRPPISAAYVMSFDTSQTASRGHPTKIYTTNINSLCFDIYTGRDRSHKQTTRPQIIFLTESPDLEKFSSLVSNEDYANVAMVTSSKGVVEVFPNTSPQTNPNVSGFDRRVLYVDGGSITEAFAQRYGTWIDSLIQKGQVELAKNQYIRLFDAEVSPKSPYVYKKDYFLGDLITLKSFYGYQEVMRISEFIRIEDDDGERGYPALAKYDEHLDIEN